MKLLRSLTVAGVYAGWPDKFENIKVNQNPPAGGFAFGNSSNSSNSG
jgi:hypothetical protein